MEYWCVDNKNGNSLAITPTLQYSNSPYLIKIDTSHDGLTFFGDYRTVRFMSVSYFRGCALSYVSIKRSILTWVYCWVVERLL